MKMYKSIRIKALMILSIFLCATSLHAVCPVIVPGLYAPTSVMEFQECVTLANTDNINSTIELQGQTFTFTAPFAGQNALPVIVGDVGTVLTIFNGTLLRTSATNFFRFFKIHPTMTAVLCL